MYPYFVKMHIKNAKIFIFVLIIIIINFVKSEKHNINNQDDGSSRSNGIDRRKPGQDDHHHQHHQVDDKFSNQHQQQQQEQLRYPGCGSCKMREEIKTRNLEAIKGEVLRIMGFQKAPNITGKALPHIPLHYLSMYDQGNMQSDEPIYKTGPSIIEEVDDYHVKTEKVITFAQPYPRLRHSAKGHDISYFQFSDSTTKFHVSNATLHMYVFGTEQRPPPIFYIEFYKLLKTNDRPDLPATAPVIARKIQQPTGKGDWIQLDITTTVSEWFKNPRENVGFIITGTINGTKVVNTDLKMDDGSKVPYVDISTREGKRRTRRNVGLNCDDKMNEPLCCRYPLTVNFESFGWDFIIAPKRYEAHYCAGECGYLTQQKHAHTHLIKMVSMGNVTPCCAPRKMSSISMLYFDEELNVVYGSLPGMVVERCGCS